MDLLSEKGDAAVAQVWPELTGWKDTRDTLHLWAQIVGKVRLALEPMFNHWWQVPLYVSARGLTTSLMHAPGVDLEIEFDFIDQTLVIRTSAADVERVALEPQSIAFFFARTMSALRSLGVEVKILARPVEVADAIPFADDRSTRQYDGAAAYRFWLALTHADRVMRRFRAGFRGKASPVHFFWGGFDLAVSRFSGRKAPKHRGGAPNCADWVMELAYSHEVSSCGFWPDGGEQGSFYSYAYPEPKGYKGWKVQPAEAYFDDDFGEFMLPYAVVRAAADPDAMLLSFFESTYEAAAELGRWNRAALEVQGQ